MMKKSKQNFSPDISVIIPMYNAEKYVEECLQSLLDQTLQNIEVIVVDDCSTDNSVKVVEEISPQFAGKLNLIKLKKNCGCAAIPRNTALKSARGKYIYFLDSDDFIDSTALEDFFKVAEEFQADVVHSERFFVRNEENKQTQDDIGTYQLGEFVEIPTLETSDIGERVAKFLQKKFLWWGCNKLFRRDFLLENKIKFPDMTSFEDYVFAFECVVAAKNYVRVPFVSYHYRVGITSLSSKPRHVFEVIKNTIKAIKNLNDFMSCRKFFVDNPDLKYAVIDFFASDRITSTVEYTIVDELSLGEIYDLFYKSVFSEKPADNVAFTSWLFMAINIYKLQTKSLENQIADLKNQLAKFQNQG